MKSGSNTNDQAIEKFMTRAHRNVFEFGGLFIFIRRDVDKTTRVGWVDRLRNLEQISA